MNVLIVAFIYLKRTIYAMESPKPCYILKIYLVCVFLAHKYLVEDELWDLEQFGNLTALSKKQLKIMEVVIVKDYLNFNLYVSQQLYSKTVRQVNY
jgi:hypothetical protein